MCRKNPENSWVSSADCNPAWGIPAVGTLLVVLIQAFVRGCIPIMLMETMICRDRLWAHLSAKEPSLGPAFRASNYGATQDLLLLSTISSCSPQNRPAASSLPHIWGYWKVVCITCGSGKVNEWGGLAFPGTVSKWASAEDAGMWGLMCIRRLLTPDACYSGSYVNGHCHLISSTLFSEGPHPFSSWRFLLSLPAASLVAPSAP